MEEFTQEEEEDYEEEGIFKGSAKPIKPVKKEQQPSSGTIDNKDGESNTPGSAQTSQKKQE